MERTREKEKGNPLEEAKKIKIQCNWKEEGKALSLL